MLKLRRPDGNDIVALVDTGFNGELLLSRADATAMGVDFDEAYEKVGYLAGMRPMREADGAFRIYWFGAESVVAVTVDLDSTHRTIAADEPVALIGSGLLDPARLVVDYHRQTVSLRAPRTA